MKKKIIQKNEKGFSLEKLALMMQEGFSEQKTQIETLDKKIESEIEKLAISVQHGFAAQKPDLEEFKDETNEPFVRIETRLDRIENIDLRAHENRIERLTDKVLSLEVALAKKA